MRHAVVTDIHGDTAGLRRVLRQVAQQNVDRLVCLGDVFECRVGKRDVPGYEFSALRDVFDPDPALARLLADAVVVRGNQEERITRLVPGHLCPAWARGLLTAPLEYTTPFAVYCHGHTLPWQEPEPGLWSPLGAGFTGTALVHGHHHRSALHRLPPGGGRRGVPQRVPVRPGVPVRLDDGARYVVNVGSVTRAGPDRGPTPAWAVLDERAATLTFHGCGPGAGPREKETA
ncbi:metallophosphoesterase family protein [Streptomyces sp. HNM0574]|uniref:metallophosphoesterase family protein n=1 Tax=Streptomyces sp. HNM0574 TaxID=2714954 RepID=UPI00146F8720|nr:metallophosphoesterase family protein [Streptomyces sp. HNM0574]